MSKTTIERAIRGGADSDRLGHAFFKGYTAAISFLDPSIAESEIGALCATEDGGGHPRAIQTTLIDGVLNGTKHFVSGGSQATQLLVVAKIGERDGRPELKVARINAKATGVKVEDLPPLDFVPEIPHGSVTFTNARVDAVLEGDGYDRYVKPFRTIEDLHVFGAIVACLIANGSRLSQSTLERFEATLASIRQLASQSPSSPQTHIALAGVLAIARETIASMDGSGFDDDFRSRFERDRPLLRIAEKVREQRRITAWSRNL
ncbi:MAG: acyl-CoA dehydrogenase family protein [Archangium sp.]